MGRIRIQTQRAPLQSPGSALPATLNAAAVANPGKVGRPAGPGKEEQVPKQLDLIRAVTPCLKEGREEQGKKVTNTSSDFLGEVVWENHGPWTETNRSRDEPS